MVYKKCSLLFVLCVLGFCVPHSFASSNSSADDDFVWEDHRFNPSVIDGGGDADGSQRPTFFHSAHLFQMVGYDEKREMYAVQFPLSDEDIVDEGVDLSPQPFQERCLLGDNCGGQERCYIDGNDNACNHRVMVPQEKIKGPLTAIGLLKVRHNRVGGGDPIDFVGTASLLRHNGDQIITAAHNLISTEAHPTVNIAGVHVEYEPESCLVEFFLGQSGAGYRAKYTVTSKHIHPEYRGDNNDLAYASVALTKSHKDFDPNAVFQFSIRVVLGEGETPAEIDQSRLNQIDKANRGLGHQSVKLAGYPGEYVSAGQLPADKMRRLRSEFLQNGYVLNAIVGGLYIMEKGPRDAISDFIRRSKEIQHRICTTQGQSGAPLWFVSKGVAHLFGIHVGGKGRFNYATSLLEHGDFLNTMLFNH